MNDTELDELLNAWETPDVRPSVRAVLRAKYSAARSRRTTGVPWRWIAALALGAGALAGGAALVENGALASDAGRWDDGVYIRRTRIVQPPIAKLKWMLMGGRSTGWRWQEDTLAGSVYLYDRLSRRHYGYTWKARPLGTGQYLFSVQPLDPSVVKEDGPIAPLAPSRAPGIVGTGSSFEVNLYVSGNERVYDRIELSGAPLSVTADREPALTITLTNPRLSINGQFVSDSDGVVEARGLTAWIDLPDRGRFGLALDPQRNARFVQAGSVNGNMIDFQSGEDRFHIECSAPVAAGGPRPLFVFTQTNATGGAPGFSSGGAPDQYR